MADSTLEELFIFNKLTDSKGIQLDINPLYTPLLVVLIIWYLLTNNTANLCTNCSNPIQPIVQPQQISHFIAAPQPPMQSIQRPYITPRLGITQREYIPNY